jgi:HAD superfamily hydrolase (TIGR01509 family)
MAKGFGLLIDLDGTLIDNEPLKARAFSLAIQELGGKSNPELYKAVMGMSGVIIRNYFIQESGIHIDSDLYFDTYKSIFEQLIRDDPRIQPGAGNFLETVFDAGFRLSIVSGSYQDSVNWIVDSLNLREFFEVIITGDDVNHKKPDPECFYLAMKKLSLAPEDVVVLEDTESGITAASKAGITSLGMRHTYNQTHDFSLAYNEYSSFENDFNMMKEDFNVLFPKANL